MKPNPNPNLNPNWLNPNWRILTHKSKNNESIIRRSLKNLLKGMLFFSAYGAQPKPKPLVLICNRNSHERSSFLCLPDMAGLVVFSTRTEKSYETEHIDDARS